MKAQITDRVLTAYRIGDPDGEFPIWDATGSKIAPGRWNTASTPMIYTSEHFSAAMLEKLVHGSGMLPPNQHFITITIPNGTSYEVFPHSKYKGWDDEVPHVSRDFGAKWRSEARSAILIVPSVVARMEQNFLINPDHKDSAKITISMHEPVHWDDRLF